MKKLSYFAIALAMTAMVACDNKKDKDDDDMDDDMEDMTEQVEPNAADQMTVAETNEDEPTLEEETFGADVKD